MFSAALALAHFSRTHQCNRVPALLKDAGRQEEGWTKERKDPYCSFSEKAEAFKFLKISGQNSGMFWELFFLFWVWCLGASRRHSSWHVGLIQSSFLIYPAYCVRHILELLSFPFLLFSLFRHTNPSFHITLSPAQSVSSPPSEFPAALNLHSGQLSPLLSASLTRYTTVLASFSKSARHFWTSKNHYSSSIPNVPSIGLTSDWLASCVPTILILSIITLPAIHTLTAKSTISYVSCWRMEQQCVLTFLLYPILFCEQRNTTVVMSYWHCIAL